MAPAAAEAADAVSAASPVSAAEAQAPGSDLPCAMGDVLHREMLMLQGADELVALAEDLAKQQRAWVADKERLLASCTAAQSAAWRQAAEQHALLAPLPCLLQQAQGARLMELRGAVHEACWVARVQRNAAWRHQEELDEALRLRQRIERSRLSRQRSQLKEEQERLEREARERLRQDGARLERERAMTDKRRAALAREHEQLVAQLELERELRLPHRKLASVQTDAPPSALPAFGPAKALPSEQDYSEESFESPGGSYEEDFDDEDVGTDSEEDEKDLSKSSEALSSGSSGKSSLDASPAPKPKPKLAPARPVPQRKAARTSEHSESIAESLSGNSILSQLPSSGQDRSSSDALPPSRPSQPRAAASAKSSASHSSRDGSNSVAESVASASRSSRGSQSSKSNGSRRRGGIGSSSGSGGIAESIQSMSG